MAINTSLTALLPDEINSRKPTLREYANEQHKLLEAQSIEMVQLKNEEMQTADLEKKPEAAKQQNQDGGLTPSQSVVPPASTM